VRSGVVLCLAVPKSLFLMIGSEFSRVVCFSCLHCPREIIFAAVCYYYPADIGVGAWLPMFGLFNSPKTGGKDVPSKAEEDGQ
jgi:hypothetical protein